MHVTDPRAGAIPDIHGHAKGEHKPYVEERPIPYSARMLFLWFYHAARRGRPRFMMVADHINYLTFEDPAAVNLVRRALKLAAAGDLYGAAETAGVDLSHAAVVSEGLRRGMRYSIGAEVDNDPRARPDAQNIVEAMKPDGLIRSVHFLSIEHPVHGPNWQWPFDNPEFAELYEAVGTQRVWEIYMNTLLEAFDKLPGQIVGHFYAPAKFGHWPDDATLAGYEDKLVAACRDRNMAIELNTRFYYRYLEDEEQKKRYLAANLRLLRKAKAQGVGIAVGSDAHSPKDQGEGFDRVLELLDAAELNELVFPIGGRLARVALRAMREAAPDQPTLEQRAEVAPAAPSEGAAETARAGTAAARKRPARPSRPRAARPARVQAPVPEAKQVAAPSPDVAQSKRSAPRAVRPGPKARAAAQPARAKKAVRAAKSAAAARRTPTASRRTAKKVKPARVKPARKKAAKGARATPKPKAQNKRKVAVAKRPKRTAPKAPSRKPAAKKVPAKKKATKSRR